MAFKVVQTFDFEDVNYSYDRDADVLYLSFGNPKAAVAIQIEDWLALRIAVGPPPGLAGMTIVGFRRIFKRVNRYIERELPDRVERLATMSMKVAYDDESDTMIVRQQGRENELSTFEPLAPNVYLEKSLPSQEVLGIKVVNYTKTGLTAIETVFGKIVDTLLQPGPGPDENVRLITRAVVRSLNWDELAAIAV